MNNDFYEQLSKDGRVKSFFPVDSECGFYELCRGFVAFAIDGAEHLVNVDGKLCPCYTEEAINTVAEQIKEFAKRYSIKDSTTLLDLINDFYDKTVSKQEEKQYSALYKETGNDLPVHYAFTFADTLQVSDNVIKRVINAISVL